MEFQTVIFDLDQTLVDSSAVESLRTTRQWSKIFTSLHLITSDVKIVELLNKLSNNDIKIGIVTNSPSNYAKAVLSYFNMPWDSLVAYHDVSRRKPDPEGFFLTLKNLNQSHHNAISIGDHDNDILASKGANIDSVGAKWFTPDYEFKVKPNYIHHTVEDLTSFFKL